MDLYTSTASELARLLTRRYSTSFSSASRLFREPARTHIYNVYGLVRIADEIVDTYDGPDRRHLLDDLQTESIAAIGRGYSPNPIVHAFAVTAREYGIGNELINPFFASMAMDITRRTYDQRHYEAYIYGSAEVVGLMCLRVFTAGDHEQYDRLAPGAQRLGAAFQKVNFLRDMAADYGQLGRFYFPGTSYAAFDAVAKQQVTADIRKDFQAALPYIESLPPAVRPAVMTSYRYFERLLARLEHTPVETIKRQRVRLQAYHKAALLTSQLVPHIVRRRP